MNTTTKIYLFLVCSTLITLSSAQCNLNGNVQLSTEIENPEGAITFDDLGLTVASTYPQPRNVSTWGGGVEIYGTVCYTADGWGLGGAFWQGGNSWYDAVGVPGHFIGANGPDNTNYCILTFTTPISSFTARAAANIGTVGGEIIAKDAEGVDIACVNVTAIAVDAPNNYYNVYGIQSSTQNIKSIVFRSNYIAADEIRFYGEISTPVAEPVAAPIEEPVAVPVTEPVTEPVAEPVAAPTEVPVATPVTEPAVAAPTAQPMAPEEPISAPETQPEAESPLVAAPVATSPSSRPNRNRVSAATTSVISGAVVLSVILLVL